MRQQEFRMIKRFATLSCILIIICGLHCAPRNASVNTVQSSIIPRPKIENLSATAITLVHTRADLKISIPDGETGPVAEGIALLSKRLERLGYALSRDPSGQVMVAYCSESTMQNLLQAHGCREQLEIERMKQSYHLAIQETEKHVAIKIEAPYPLGIYYGIVSLCQLLATNKAGDLSLPAGEVLDYPEIAIRLAKTSASLNPPDSIAHLARWLSACKLSYIGLQYHGDHSRQPEPHFPENIRRLCPELRRAGTLESIVYFCPFRGDIGDATGAYDFSSPEDLAAYAEYLRWIMAQGASGIEVDYNDWPGSAEVPIADVLNLVYRTLAETYPGACILYCPPVQGAEQYHGIATSELGRTLSRVPARVWPLWTGMGILIADPLSDEQVEEWTRIAGRRPFLWVNRAGPAVETAFACEVEGQQGGFVFNGGLLPKDLHRLFEGVHLNVALGTGYNELPDNFDTEALVYLATAADYLWNPHDWQAEESLRRGRRFVEVTSPLLEGTQIGVAKGLENP